MRVLLSDGWEVSSDKHNWMVTTPAPEGLTKEGNPFKGVTTYHKDLHDVAAKVLSERAKSGRDLAEISRILKESVLLLATRLEEMEVGDE